MDLVTALVVTVANVPLHLLAYYAYMYWTYDLKVTIQQLRAELAWSEKTAVSHKDLYKEVDTKYAGLLDAKLKENEQLRKENQAVMDKLLTTITKKD